jgi:hypothetical protein
LVYAKNNDILSIHVEVIKPLIRKANVYYYIYFFIKKVNIKEGSWMRSGRNPVRVRVTGASGQYNDV